MTLNLANQRFGKLEAKHRTASHVTPNGKQHAKWLCVCECGGTIMAFASGLKAGTTTHCGCMKVAHARAMTENRAVKKSSQLDGRRREYNIWKGMIQRCTNPKNPSYHRYGGRGIEVCQAWKDSFDLFFQDVGPIPLGLEIDRINNDVGYEPGNVRVTTRSINMANAHLRWEHRSRDENGKFQ